MSGQVESNRDCIGEEPTDEQSLAERVRRLELLFADVTLVLGGIASELERHLARGPELVELSLLDLLKEKRP